MSTQYELSSKVKESIATLGSTLEEQDKAIKELYQTMLSEALRLNEVHLKEWKKASLAYVKEEINTKWVQTKVRTVINTVYKASSMKLSAHTDKLSYDVLKSYVSLAHYLLNNTELGKAGVGRLKRKVAKVKAETVPAYNDRVLDIINEFKKEFKVVETADGETIKFNPTQEATKVVNNIDKFSQEQLETMMRAIQSKLGSE